MSIERKLLTLCLVVDGERLLLGMKKRGFGAGKWNGFGGKVQRGESLERAACRELAEEVGLTVQAADLRKRAVLEFIYHDQLVHEVHVFLVNEWSGEVGESEEMYPAWFNYSDVPYREMWEDDQYWLPVVLRGEMLQGRFQFDAEQKLLSHDLKRLTSLNA